MAADRAGTRPTAVPPAPAGSRAAGTSEPAPGRDPARGRTTRVQLVQIDSKYPLTRIEEDVVDDAASGEAIVVSRREMVADHIIVQLRPGMDEGRLARLNRATGGSVRRRLRAPGLYLVRFPDPDVDTVPAQVAAYGRQEELVEYAEPDRIVRLLSTFPNDPYFSSLWGLHRGDDHDIDAPEAWDLVRGTRDVVVAVIDTGVDWDHVDLAANIWANPGETGGNGVDDDGNGYVDDVRGWDFFHDDNNPDDDHSHGTHVSGTIGALGNNGVGVVGVNWQVKIIGLKFISKDNVGYDSDAADAFDYVKDLRERGINVRLSNNSWGGDGWSSTLYNAIVRQRDAGLLCAAASGNDSRNADVTPLYPAAFSLGNIISVAATDAADNRAWFSNWGVTSVDLAAPGVSIRSTVLNNGYGDKNGTSMATPHVAGVAALAWHRKSGASWQEVKAAILGGVDPVSSMSGKVVTGGRLNALGTLLLLDVHQSGAMFKIR